MTDTRQTAVTDGFGNEESAYVPDVYQVRSVVEEEVKRLAARLRALSADAGNDTVLFKPLASSFAGGGKRLRPLLMVAAYLGWSRRVTGTVARASAALELMHAFALIHDDIVDKTERRRGTVSLHRRYAADLFGNPERQEGVSMAMVGADLLFAYAVDAFLDAYGHTRSGIDALRMLLQAATLTARGQFEEIAHGGPGALQRPEESIWHTYDLKTGHYSFQAPLCAGATLSGAPERSIERLDRAGMHFGRAYQALDDLQDLVGGPEDIETRFDDLRNGVVTVPLHRLYRRCKQKHTRTLIERVIAETNPRQESCRRIAAWVRAYGIEEEIRDDIAQHCRAAFELVACAGCGEHARRLLEQIAGTLFGTAGIRFPLREAS